MDTRTVSGLAGKAVEGVLEFRVNAFESKAFIDIKSIKLATGSTIRAICKQRGYSGEVPLVNVVEIAGSAVSSAAEKWNKVADPKNHVDREWLRNCVCDLVGGAVTHAAFKENEWLSAELLQRDNEEEKEYLDPAGHDYEDMSDDTINTVIHKPTTAVARLKDDDGYYGLQQIHPIEHKGIPDDDAAILQRHQIELSLPALRDGEADPSAWTTVNNTTASPARPYYLDAPFRKRPAPVTDSEGDDESGAQIIQRKRCCNVEKDPSIPMAETISDNAEDDEDYGEVGAVDEVPSQRKVSSKMLWTPADADRLVTIRESGKTWDEVHVSFSNRTKAAIMNKYRTLKDGEQSSIRDVAG